MRLSIKRMKLSKKSYINEKRPSKETYTTEKRRVKEKRDRKETCKRGLYI